MSDDRCGAKTRSGGYCANFPLPGTNRCKLHGGASPQAQKKAAERLARQQTERRAARSNKTLGLRGDENLDPSQILLGEIAWTHAHVEWLREKVQELEPENLVWSAAQHEHGDMPLGSVDVITEKAGPSIWYELYLRERKHLADVTARAIQAGIEQRRVQLAERQGELVALALQRILGSLGLTATQWEKSRAVIPRELRALASLES